MLICPDGSVCTVLRGCMKMLLFYCMSLTIRNWKCGDKNFKPTWITRPPCYLKALIAETQVLKRQNRYCHKHKVVVQINFPSSYMTRMGGGGKGSIPGKKRVQKYVGHRRVSQSDSRISCASKCTSCTIQILMRHRIKHHLGKVWLLAAASSGSEDQTSQGTDL